MKALTVIMSSLAITFSIVFGMYWLAIINFFVLIWVLEETK